ncbi:uncharacterized protein LOC102672137 [Apis dorsata]|uniref:uncharacterized protein LOC102672137 n=1 Tax=Apis dorsata TaxID=7462 RepID=UPI0003DF5499|nr:uncharacterized protein LOC102672137 [Apis dorsata]
MKMPTESSIYWDSIGSQHSISVGSSGDGCSSASASRHYVDPWDLENYAYLRRHSVAGVAQQVPPRHRRRSAYRLSQDARAHSEYWYTPSVREPGYDAPAFVEELYCGPARSTNNSCYYHQPIYEDEVPDYVAPYPVYAPLSGKINCFFPDCPHHPSNRGLSTKLQTTEIVLRRKINYLFC